MVERLQIMYFFLHRSKIGILQKLSSTMYCLLTRDPIITKNHFCTLSIYVSRRVLMYFIPKCENRAPVGVVICKWTQKIRKYIIRLTEDHFSITL